MRPGDRVAVYKLKRRAENIEEMRARYRPEADRDAANGAEAIVISGSLTRGLASDLPKSM